MRAYWLRLIFVSLASNELNQVHGSFTSCGIKYNGHGRMRTNKT